MAKTDVYSWRLEPGLKASLEDRARSAKLSLAELLTQISTQWLKAESMDRAEDDAAEQARLHAKARRFIGQIAGDNPHRAENTRALLREKLKRRRARS